MIHKLYTLEAHNVQDFRFTHCLIGLMSNTKTLYSLFLFVTENVPEAIWWEGKAGCKKPKGGVLLFNPAVVSKPAHRIVFQRTSCFPGDVILFQAVSELLGLSEKLQVVVRVPTFLSFLLSLNRRRNRWLDPTQLLGCVFLRAWLALGQFMDLCRSRRHKTLQHLPYLNNQWWI